MGKYNIHLPVRENSCTYMFYLLVQVTNFRGSVISLRYSGFKKKTL